MQKIFVYATLSLILFFGIFLCFKKTGGIYAPTLYKSKALATNTLRVGIMDWPGFYPLILALKDNKFESANFKVELVKGKDNADLNAFIETGKVDLCFGVFADHLLMRGNNKKIKFIYATDFSKSDVLIGDNNIHSISQLVGKKIGITDLNSFSEFFIHHLLVKNKIPDTKISFKIVPFDQINESLDQKEISAGHTWEPETTTALQNGRKILANSYEVKGIITDGLMATESILETNQKEIVNFIKVFNDYQIQIQQFNEENIKYLAKEFNSTETLVREGIKTGVEFIDLEKNIEMFSSKKDFALAHWSEKISVFYSERGQILNTVAPSEILDNSIILKAYQDRKSEIKK